MFYTLKLCVDQKKNLNTKLNSLAQVQKKNDKKINTQNICYAVHKKDGKKDGFAVKKYREQTNHFEF